MRKTYKCSLLALSVLASFTSCSESESLQQANLSKDKITFHATLDNTWKSLSPASSSRAAIAAAAEKGPIVVPTPFGKPLYLHPVVQDGIHIWSKEGKPITRSGAPLEDVEHERVAQTRGIMSTEIGDYDSFGVTAIYKEEDNNVLLLDNAEAEKTDGEFWGFKNNSNARWPIGSTVSFHAYAPHSSADKSMLTYGVDKDNVQTKITYTASTKADDIINQPDLIVATNTGSRQLTDADEAVQLDFYHALTAVSFAIDKDLADVVGKGGKMTSVTLKGIPNKGNCNLSVSATANAPTADWTMENGTGEYTFDLSNANIVVGEKDQALTSDNRTLMMIPQTLPEGAELCFNLDMNGTTQEWKVPLKGQVWEAGKSIIYKLSSNSINMLDDTKIVYPGTWTAHSFPKTSFGENDVVGLYVVNKFNQIVAENVQLTKTKGEENTFTWKTKDNKNFSFSTDNKYFAYYPYKSDAQTVNPSASDASTFFASKISSLSPASDQSTQNTLLAQDFQVAKGVVASDASTLTFLMEHAMGLAEITLDAKTFDANYRLSNYYDYTWKKITTFHACARISGYSFYKVADYRYVALVKPNVTTRFSCGDNNDPDAWTENVLSVSPAANSVAKDTATSNRDPNSYILYTMEVGDIYYNDGAMTHQNEDLASEKTPIGIVGYTGNDYWTEKGVSGKGGHALVMCLKTIGSNGSPEAALEDFNRHGINGETYKAYIGTGYAWAPSDDDAGREWIDSKDKLVNSYKYSYGSGYTETAALIKKWNTKAAAAYQAQNYNTLPANSPKCTGWFLPTAGQYYAVMTTLGASFSRDWTGIYDGVTSTHPKFGFFSNMTTVTTNINNKLKKVGDDLKYTEFFGNINTWAWTSSQLRSTDAVYIDSGIDDPNESGANGSVRFFYANYKNSALLPPVRPFLAF